MNEEIKIKSFEEYYKYYEGSGILPILEEFIIKREKELYGEQ